MKTLKKISKNIIATIIIISLVLCVIPLFLFAIIIRYISEIDNFMNRRKTNFPKISFTKIYYEIKYYYTLELCEIFVMLFSLIIYAGYISKWTLKNNQKI